MAAAAAVSACALVGSLVATGGASAAPPDFTVRGSVNQVYVLDGTPGESLELRDGAGGVVASGTVDELGSLVWRELDAGAYTVHGAAGDLAVTVADFDDAAPAQAFYDAQTLDRGFGYITTRDGTTLSANVALPPGPGPYPTVVEYSGYGPSNPADSTFAQIYNALGFAYVGVNMRGTGCSGGSFFHFEPVQSLDGYDAIETVAAQPWAKFHEVGMVGISYPGISQLYVARTQPPHLSAITPLSVLDDSFRGTLYPGGILNTGFAFPWAAERSEQAQPYGQGWEQGIVDAGGADGAECERNQRVRLQNPDALAMIEDNPFYDPAVADKLNPSLFVRDIDVPVFLAGAWQDEQTGGHFPALLDDLDSVPQLYATMVNGSHTESLSLGVLGRYADFLDLYVARRVPGSAKSFIAPILAGRLTGVGGLSLPPQIDYTGMGYEQALAKFEAQKRIRILFEEGAADGQPSGSPLPRFARGFDAWPVPQARPTAWYLTPGGRLRATPAEQSPRKAKVRGYTADPGALPPTTYTGSSDGVWRAHPDYDWRQIPKGKGLGWTSRPLKKDVVAIGTGSVDLWVRSDAADTDLEVTLTEVRPHGKEVYVQSGWLRASHRKVDVARSTPTSPFQTHLEADRAPLPAGELTKLRVELFPFAQPFRAGSRIRITVDAPGNSRPLWAFDDTIADGERVEIAADRVHRSRVVLAVVPGVRVPGKAPACAALRSQPCRTFDGTRG